MNHEVKTKKPLLDKQGHLVEKGYAKCMHFIYNREYVKSFPLKLKEWNFYQFQKDHYVLQFTIGHVSYMGQACVTLINLDTGDKWSIGTMKPLMIPALDLNPEAPSICEYKEDNFYLSYKVTTDKRILYFKGSSKDYTNIEVKLVVDNDIHNEKLVIATPFSKPPQFYLNYKENYYHADGFARFISADSKVSSKEADFNNSTGLIDWGRGVWPYSHEWYWGNLTAHIDGVPFGFNIGWGFGDTSRATENMYFYNKKAYKIGKLITEWDNNNLMKQQFIHDSENKLQMTFTPFYNNHTENKYVVVDTECDQIFGYFTGSIETEDGRKEFHDVVAFIEHAVNHW
ncbi:MAG: DUF2804 domain-containing protein [Agathobacter sp.]|nr:DUF2804 domain-containing protein [Agathobacter sp.]